MLRDGLRTFGLAGTTRITRKASPVTESCATPSGAEYGARLPSVTPTAGETDPLAEHFGGRARESVSQSGRWIGTPGISTESLMAWSVWGMRSHPTSLRASTTP